MIQTDIKNPFTYAKVLAVVFGVTGYYYLDAGTFGLLYYFAAGVLLGWWIECSIEAWKKQKKSSKKNIHWPGSTVLFPRKEWEKKIWKPFMELLYFETVLPEGMTAKDAFDCNPFRVFFATTFVAHAYLAAIGLVDNTIPEITAYWFSVTQPLVDLLGQVVPAIDYTTKEYTEAGYAHRVPFLTHAYTMSMAFSIVGFFAAFYRAPDFCRLWAHKINVSLNDSIKSSIKKLFKFTISLIGMGLLFYFIFFTYGAGTGVDKSAVSWVNLTHHLSNVSVLFSALVAPCVISFFLPATILSFFSGVTVFVRRVI